MPKSRAGEPVIPVLVGPFPLPVPGGVGGVSATNAKLATMLEARGLVYERIDTAGNIKRTPFHHLKRLARSAAAFGRITFASSRNERRYEVSLDGGKGTIYNTFVALAARLRGAPTFLYHHSTSYILSDNMLMKLLVLAAGKNATHIACSPRMFEMFRVRYHVPDRFLHISNAAWIAASPVAQAPPNPSKLHLGYLGMLSESKGVLRALEVFTTLRTRGVDARITIAGAISSDQVQSAIKSACAKFGDDVSFRGHLSDEEKWQMFATLDYFLFPSLYPHETQSSVAPEAMSAGVPVICYDHRFVGELVGTEGGLVVPTSENFAAAASDWISTALPTSDRLERRRRVRAHYELIYSQAAGQVETLIDRLVSSDK